MTTPHAQEGNEAKKRPWYEENYKTLSVAASIAIALALGSAFAMTIHGDNPIMGYSIGFIFGVSIFITFYLSQKDLIENKDSKTGSFAGRPNVKQPDAAESTGEHSENS